MLYISSCIDCALTGRYVTWLPGARLQCWMLLTVYTNHGISPLHQLLLTLRFYALGTMLLSVADFAGVSKSSASRIVRDVSFAIAQLYRHYIKIRSDTEEAFYQIARFPRVLGAIDGTHVKIQSPNSQIGEEFRNRKGYFSINVQAVCDANLLLMNVVARWPGSAHDATIFNNSELRAQCESGMFGNKWLLGDSAYPLKPYLLTPLLNPADRGELLYNEAQIRTRNCIERCFGVWKRRFPVVSLCMRLSLLNAHAVIIATAVLHNICRTQSMGVVPPEVEIPPEDVDEPQEDADSTINNNDRSLNTERAILIANYFNKLPQLAVSAKILCLLMVVICGAVPSMVRSVRLYSQCSHLYLNVYPNGTVMARSDGNDQPNLTISTRGFSLDLLIHSPVQDMYLCFNRSRLVGRRLTRFQAERQPNCLFKEEFVDGYNRYHLVKNEDRYIGFNRRGLQMRRGKSRLSERLHKCFSFMKEAHDFDINRHNTMLAGDLPKWRAYPQRRLRPPSQNSIKPPCHGVRHHHGRHQRRRNCDGT